MIRKHYSKIPNDKKALKSKSKTDPILVRGVQPGLNIFKANILFTSFEVQTMPQTDGDDSAS